MKKIIVLILSLASINAFAQDSEPIVTDRPTQSAASTVVPKGSALLEYGFVYEKASSDATNVTWANILARLGIINGVELRLTQNVLQTGPSFSSEDNVSGLSPTTIGTKVYLVEEQGAIPQISMIGQVTLANGKEAFRPSKALPEVRLNFSNSLSEYLSLGYNIGMGFPEDDRYALYTLVLGYSFLPGWSVFAEPYGFMYEGYSDHRFNTGIVYLVNDRFQVDMTGGIGLSDSSPDSFVGFGLALGF
ncbi:MAG: hypothetical protein Tsb0034_31440 [Ekhidna sp.]